MKELQTLIDKWKLELHFYTAAYNTEDLTKISSTPDMYKAIAIRDFVSDLENLNQKILNAQDKSRSVTLHEESKESCSHKTVLCTRDPSIFQCSDCGQLMKGKMDDSGGSMPHEG